MSSSEWVIEYSGWGPEWNVPFDLDSDMLPIDGMGKKAKTGMLGCKRWKYKDQGAWEAIDVNLADPRLMAWKRTLKVGSKIMLKDKFNINDFWYQGVVRQAAKVKGGKAKKRAGRKKRTAATTAKVKVNLKEFFTDVWPGIECLGWSVERVPAKGRRKAKLVFTAPESGSELREEVESVEALLDHLGAKSHAAARMRVQAQEDPRLLCKGTAVEARWHGNAGEGDGEYYPGVITDISAEGKYTILFDDGDTQGNAKRETVRHLKKKKPRARESTSLHVSRQISAKRFSRPPGRAPAGQTWDYGIGEWVTASSASSSSSSSSSRNTTSRSSGSSSRTTTSTAAAVTAAAAAAASSSRSRKPSRKAAEAAATSTTTTTSTKARARVKAVAKASSDRRKKKVAVAEGDLIKIGQWVRAQWTDKLWYLAEVVAKQSKGHYHVRFEDGVTQTVPLSKITLDTTSSVIRKEQTVKEAVKAGAKANQARAKKKGGRPKKKKHSGAKRDRGYVLLKGKISKDETGIDGPKIIIEGQWSYNPVEFTNAMPFRYERVLRADGSSGPILAEQISGPFNGFFVCETPESQPGTGLFEKEVVENDVRFEFKPLTGNEPEDAIPDDVDMPSATHTMGGSGKNGFGPFRIVGMLDIVEKKFTCHKAYTGKPPKKRRTTTTTTTTTTEHWTGGARMTGSPLVNTTTTKLENSSVDSTLSNGNGHASPMPSPSKLMNAITSTSTSPSWGKSKIGGAAAAAEAALDAGMMGADDLGTVEVTEPEEEISRGTNWKDRDTCSSCLANNTRLLRCNVEPEQHSWCEKCIIEQIGINFEQLQRFPEIWSCKKCPKPYS